MMALLTKICSRCGILKDSSEFNKRHDRITGIQSHCKECQKARHAKYRQTEEGIKKERETRKVHYLANRTDQLAANREWRKANQERRKEYLDMYEKTQRKRDERLLKVYRKRARLRNIATIPLFRVNQAMSGSVRRGLITGKQGMHWESLVGYTCNDLAKRLVKTLPAGYSWDDFTRGKTDLSIDHIIPIAAFNFSTTDDLDFKRCWALSNLRLIPKSVNCSKKDNLQRPFQPCLQMSA
jgi:hypothetical protein